MRRHVLPLVVLAALSGGCAPSAPPSRSVRAEPSPTAPPRAPLAAQADTTPLVYEEFVTGGASAEEPLPLVIGIHGLGDSPAGVRFFAERFVGRARFALPRAPTPYGPGYAWFPFYDGRGTPQQYADGVSSAAVRIAATIRQVRATRPSLGKTVVTGFSQGGMLSYALAAHYPELVDVAIPISGFLPSPLLPRAGARVATIRAMHGNADDIVPLARDEESIAALRALGADVALRTYPGVRHTITAQMADDLSAAITEALAR